MVDRSDSPVAKPRNIAPGRERTVQEAGPARLLPPWSWWPTSHERADAVQLRGLAAGVALPEEKW